MLHVELSGDITTATGSSMDFEGEQRVAQRIREDEVKIMVAREIEKHDAVGREVKCQHKQPGLGQLSSPILSSARARNRSAAHRAPSSQHAPLHAPPSPSSSPPHLFIEYAREWAKRGDRTFSS
jgi:hypothetical protein